MKQQKQTPAKQSKAAYRNTELSVITIIHEGDDISTLLESFELLREKSDDNIELIVITDGYSFAPSILSESGTMLKVIEWNKNSCLSEQLTQAAAMAKHDKIMLLSSSRLKTPLPLNELYSVKKQIAENESVMPTSDPSMLIISKDISEYIFSNIISGNLNNNQEIIYLLNKLGHPPVRLKLQHNKPEMLLTLNIIKRFFRVFSYFLNWHIRIPIKDIRHKVHNKYNTHSIYRLIFTAVITLMFPVMILMSLNSGISGDEYVNYEHAGYVYDFYKTMGKDTLALNTPKTKLQYYGQSFDNITYIINKVFDVKNYYDLRHVLNSMVGWFAILVAGLFASYIAGWRAALITILLMFFTPSFLGHSFNNPKDIPFAATFILGVYAISKNMRRLNNPCIFLYVLAAVSIGLAISIRIGGLLLVAFLFMFTGFKYLFDNYNKGIFRIDFIKGLLRILIIMAVVSASGYMLGLIFWPYALIDPINNPIESLKVMTNFEASLRQLFDGDILWSDNIPWYYAPKYILITVPLILLAGIMFFVIALSSGKLKANRFDLFIILFVLIFPVFYVIYKNSNLYGGWRHVLFVLPPMAILSAIGLNAALDFFKNKIYKIILAAAMGLLLLLPAIHIIKYHPHEYVYYNELAGGVKSAYGKYEMDYYFHSMRAGTEWITENVIPKLEKGKKIIVASNVRAEYLSYYFRKNIDKVTPRYVRYYERGNIDWDYAVFVNTYINPYVLNNNKWPPKNAIHTIDIEGKPICAILKRTNKYDYEGIKFLANESFYPPKAIEYFNLSLADTNTSDNEACLINLSRAYSIIEDYDNAIKTCYRCLKVYPDYELALFHIGKFYLMKADSERNKGNAEAYNYVDTALAALNRATLVNPKFSDSYYLIGLIFADRNNPNRAFEYFRKTLEINSNNRNAYIMASEMLKRMGHTEEAELYLQAASRL